MSYRLVSLHIRLGFGRMTGGGIEVLGRRDAYVAINNLTHRSPKNGNKRYR